MIRDSQEYTVVADLVVHAAGRVPEIDDLDLDAAGVARQQDGVSVNAYLQSVTNPAVYAAGDAVASGGFPLTPVAGMQGDIVARNLLEGNRHTPNYTGIPSVVFTTPPLARVGMDEAGAHAQGLRFRTRHEDTSGWYSSRRVALPHTGFKVLVEEGTDRILGAHLLGLHAEEVINLFALAVKGACAMTTARWNDVVLAESDHCRMVEGNYYFPPDSVHREYLKPSRAHSLCLVSIGVSILTSARPPVDALTL